MKRIIFLLICLTISFGASYAQVDGSVTFNEKKHEFGVIPEKGGNATFDFIITNNSTNPLLINQVQTSCGCTTPSWTRTPIEPKKSGTITVSYNPLGRIGPFDKTITVYTNLSSTPFYLQITGEVTNAPVPKKPEELYPVALGNYLLKSKDLNFGKLGISDSKTIRLEVFNNSDKLMSQSINQRKYFTTTYSQTIEPKKESTVDITFLPKEFNKYGYVNGELTFYIDGRKQVFPFSALIMDDFNSWTPAKKNNAGKLNVNSNEISYGNFTTGTSKTLKLSNSGKSVLNIRNIQSSSPWVIPSKTNFVIGMDEIAEIKVSIEKSKITSPFAATLSIISDDPKNPLYEVKIIANP